MTKVLKLLSNAFRPDPRVAREAAALAKDGYRVCILAWDRRAELAQHEDRDGYEVRRVHTVRSRYGAGARQIVYLPRFWREARRFAEQFQPDIVHCHDLDTLPAGASIKDKTGAALIYDAHEEYPALMSLYLPAFMVRLLALLEKRLMRKTDHVITASSVLADKYRFQGVRAVTTLGNHADLAPFDLVRPEEVLAVRRELEIEPGQLLVAYIGGFSRNRVILPLIEAAEGLESVRVAIWGDGHQREQIEAAVDSSKHARYLGWLPTSRLPVTMQAVDVMVYCLREDYPGAIYNAPNTLSNSMAAGRPIVCNRVGDLGRIVEKTGCGILLDEVTSGSIGAAIEKLKHAKIRETLGQAGRRAAETSYNWAATAGKLSEIYHALHPDRRS